MSESQTSLPEDPWDELIHQGDIHEESVRAVPAIVAALSRGTDDDENWLHVLAGMCVGRPARLAQRVREETMNGADVYRRDLTPAAVGVLAASGAANADDRRRFAGLARSEPAAALALGLESGFEAELRVLLDADDLAIRYAAALALGKLDEADDAVMCVLVEGVGEDEAEDVTARRPWDALYAEPVSAAAITGALPYLLVRLKGETEVIAAIGLAEAALVVARDDRERLQVVRRIVANDAAWERERQLAATLKRHALPVAREELGAWLGG